MDKTHFHIHEPPPCPEGHDPTEWASEVDRGYFETFPGETKYVRFRIPGETPQAALDAVLPDGQVEVVEVSLLRPGLRSKRFCVAEASLAGGEPSWLTGEILAACDKALATNQPAYASDAEGDRVVALSDVWRLEHEANGLTLDKAPTLERDGRTVAIYRMPKVAP